MFPLDVGCQDCCPHFLPCLPEIERFKKPTKQLLPWSAPHLQGGQQGLCTPVHRATLPSSPVACDRQHQGECYPGPALCRLRELVRGFPGSTLTGLVSVRNSVFLSTRSVSARRGDLEQGPQEVSFSDWTPPIALSQPLFSPAAPKHAWPVSHSGAWTQALEEVLLRPQGQCILPPPGPAPAASPAVPLSLRPFPVETQNAPSTGALWDTGDARTTSTPNPRAKSSPWSRHLAQFLSPNCGHLGPGHSLLVGTAVCTGGYLAASLASSHKMLIASPSRDNQKHLQTLHGCPQLSPGL